VTLQLKGGGGGEKFMALKFPRPSPSARGTCQGG
jgi:hypothetical protein